MRYIALSILFFCFSCNRQPDQRVVFHIKGAFNRHFLLERAGFNGEKPRVIDSGVARSNRDSFVYDLPSSEHAVYWILPEYKGYRIPFIHDSTGLRIVYDYNRDEYHFENSPASEEWRRFQQRQQGAATQMEALSHQPAVAIRPVIDSLMRITARNNFHFADTTTNPALFLLAYDLVDFSGDYHGLEQFMRRAAKRFPGNAAVRTLVSNSLDYVRIFNSPLHIGDTLPSLYLPDSSGHPIAVAPVKDKYLLVDCWSSWCASCRIFSAAKKKAWQDADTGKFAIVSIAVDAEKQAWLNILRFERYPWQQLIDEKMWSGPAARTLHVDSLPYNFLVAPGGRILARSIPADSLILVLAGRGIIRKHN